MELSFLSVSVNHVDTLVPRKELNSPVVRVSVLDEDTGQYLGFRSTFDISNFERKGKQKTATAMAMAISVTSAGGRRVAWPSSRCRRLQSLAMRV